MAGGIKGTIYVRFMGLCFPQRLFLPVLWEAHGFCKRLRLVVEQYEDFLVEIAVRTNVLFQICQIAKLGVKFHRPQSRSANPFQWQFFRQMRHYGKTPIPKTCMVGAIVTEYGCAFHPTFQIQVLRQSETSSHCLFHFRIAEVAVQLGERSEWNHFHRFPYGR